MKNIFVIEMGGEENIGIIDLGNSFFDDANKEATIEVLKPKISEAIRSHFDADINIVDVDINNRSFAPTINVKFVFKDGYNDAVRSLTLNRTWIY